MLPVWKQIFSISIWVHGRPLTLSRRGKCLQSTFPSTLRGISGAMCPDDAVLATTVLFAQSCGKREGGFHDFGNTKGKHCWKNNTSVQQTRRCTAAHWKPFKYMMATKRRVTALQSAAWEGGYFYYDFPSLATQSLKSGKMLRDGWETKAGGIPAGFAPDCKPSWVKDVPFKHSCHHIPELRNIQALGCKGRKKTPFPGTPRALWTCKPRLYSTDMSIYWSPGDFSAQVLCWTGLP